jgi:hypothetical protein
MRSVWLGLAFAVACSGNGNGHHSAMPAELGGSTGTGGSLAHSGSSAMSDAGAAGDSEAVGGAGSADAGANAGGQAGDGIVFETAGAPTQAPPGACAPDMMLGSAQAQDVGVADITLLAMTSDELSVAFTTGSGDTLVLHVSDRGTTQADFTEVSVTVPAGYDAKSGVSLASDGSRLLLVGEDHASFAELSRAKRGTAFEGDVDTTPYAKLNSLKAMSGHSLGWPVLSSDGKDLYFVSYFGQALVTQSHLGQDGAFDYGTEIDPFTLGGPPGEYKLLSGLSSDQRAIFFFDEVTQHAMALFRSRDGAPFYDPLDLGARRGAVPNKDCSRVYSSVAAGLVAQATQ